MGPEYVGCMVMDPTSSTSPASIPMIKANIRVAAVVENMKVLGEHHESHLPPARPVEPGLVAGAA